MSTRTLVLGLLAELAGGGVRFLGPSEFAAGAFDHGAIDAATRAGIAAPHSLTVVVDAPPPSALPFARSCSAIGVSATFLVRSSRGAGSAALRDAGPFARLTQMGHHLGLLAPAEVAPGELDSGARDSAISALSVEGDADGDLTTELLKASGLPVHLGPTTVARGRKARVAFMMEHDRERLRARSVQPAFTLLDTPLRDLTSVDVDCLLDTVARGACLLSLRLSAVA